MAGIHLYPYQTEAVERMHNGCILCGGVGSGKSRTSLAYYYLLNGGKINENRYFEMKNPKDLYIITTAKKRDTLEWEQELNYYRMTTKKENSMYNNDICVDSWNNIKKYVNVKNAFFIFDEQRVVGSGAWVRSFLKITKSNEWILLSATPGDTWTDYIPVFVANGYYKHRTEFIREHVIYKSFTNFPQIDRYVNTGRLIRLRNKTLVGMDFKRETIPHHIDICVDYDKEAYRRCSKERWNFIKDEPIKNASEYCQLLRRIVNSADSRQLAVLDILDKHPKAIIFYNYDYELEILRGLCYGKDVEIAECNGHKQQPVPDGNSWVYLVQYNSGSEGWNCVKTDTIIFFSQNYSYRIMTQAAGRIDRLNTPYTDLYFYHLKSQSGIDLAIAKALKNKKKFNENSYFSAATFVAKNF